MVRHIVLFKLKNTLAEAEKREVMVAFKQAIEALPAQIDVIRHIEVGLNMNPDEAFDIALNGEFDSLEDVRFYAAHPAHLAAASLLKDAKESRACTDYEF